jgi:hypothetical protein
LFQTLEPISAEEINATVAAFMAAQGPVKE